MQNALVGGRGRMAVGKGNEGAGLKIIRGRKKKVKTASKMG